MPGSHWVGLLGKCGQPSTVTSCDLPHLSLPIGDLMALFVIKQHNTGLLSSNREHHEACLIPLPSSWGFLDRAPLFIWCCDFKTSNWCQSVDGPCNNNTDLSKLPLPVIAKHSGHIRAKTRGGSVGRSQRAVLLRPCFGRGASGMKNDWSQR